jgi:hypothetical protein
MLYDFHHSLTLTRATASSLSSKTLQKVYQVSHFCGFLGTAMRWFCGADIRAGLWGWRMGRPPQAPRFRPKVVLISLSSYILFTLLCYMLRLKSFFNVKFRSVVLRCLLYRNRLHVAPKRHQSPGHNTLTFNVRMLDISNAAGTP